MDYDGSSGYNGLDEAKIVKTNLFLWEVMKQCNDL